MTYVNSTFFIVPLIPILIHKAYRQPAELRRWRDEIQEKVLGRQVQQKEEDGGQMSFDDAEGDMHAMASSQTLLLGENPERSVSGNAAPLTFTETLRLSMEFCLLWTLANYFVSACLQYTTVASSTILTSTSSVFTLIFGVLVRVEVFTLRKAIGIVASLAGIALISTIDMSGHSNDADHRGDFPQKTPQEMAVGNCLALISAIMYGLYAVLMKKRIADESRVNMPLFFGLVGVVNFVLLWPGFIILHFTGVERFELPPSGYVLTIILCNSLASLISDLTWAYAVLLTSPLVVTLGLSLTIPLSLIGQIVLNNQTSDLWYWVGALMVVLSFIFVSHEDKKEDLHSVADFSELDETPPRPYSRGGHPSYSTAGL